MIQPKDTHIRSFHNSDVESIVLLIHNTIDTCYTGIYPPKAVAFFKEFHSSNDILKRSQKGLTLVLEQCGNIVGTGAIVNDEIYAVFVHPNMQGHGLGNSLMCALEKHAKAEGYERISLSVSLPSRKFYENLGYVVREEKHIDVGEGQQLNFWHAEKQLG